MQNSWVESDFKFLEMILRSRCGARVVVAHKIKFTYYNEQSCKI